MFNYYDNIYPLTVDVCSTRKLAKCKKFYTPKQNGLSKEWVGVCWINPPYSSLGAWVKKAHEAAKNGAVVVALLPMFTDTAWFHDYASHATIEALKGRLQFENRPDNGYSSFGHAIFVFRQKSARAGDQLAISVAGHRSAPGSVSDVEVGAVLGCNRGLLAQRVHEEQLRYELALAD